LVKLLQLFSRKSFVSIQFLVANRGRSLQLVWQKFKYFEFIFFFLFNFFYCFDFLFAIISFLCLFDTIFVLWFYSCILDLILIFLDLCLTITTCFPIFLNLWGKMVLIKLFVLPQYGFKGVIESLVWILCSLDILTFTYRINSQRWRIIPNELGHDSHRFLFEGEVRVT